MEAAAAAAMRNDEALVASRSGGQRENLRETTSWACGPSPYEQLQAQREEKNRIQNFHNERNPNRRKSLARLVTACRLGMMGILQQHGFLEYEIVFFCRTTLSFGVCGVDTLQQLQQAPKLTAVTATAAAISHAGVTLGNL